ncbi:MAG TPA: hypothetical protein VGQ10_10620 [Vicinamibacterales bacterium]|nr:hypothetical protein [Vicinamibacterales bacterium]
MRASPYQPVYDLGLFELDGNAVDDPAAAGADWSTVNVDGGGALGPACTPIPPIGIFTGDGSKDSRTSRQRRCRARGNRR